jgi:uncharacterized membrane protein
MTQQVTGSVIPPLPYLLVLVALAVAVGAVLAWRRPTVDDRVVLALVPWMLVGAGLRTLPQIGAAPSVLSPLFGVTSVYLTTFAVAGGLWALLDYAVGDCGVPVLAGTGAVAFVAVVAAAVAGGSSFRPAWSVAGLLLSAVVAGVVWWALRRFDPEMDRELFSVGPLVIFAHTLDGVSTAIGVDVLRFGERTPTSRLILELSANLPGADVLGVGWPFVVLKVGLAAVVLHLLAEFVHESPSQGYLLLGAVAAVGLGPGVHNLLLYAVATGVPV